MSESPASEQKKGSKTLRRSIFTLSFSNALEMAIQVTLPMALVRLLTEGDFGLYRALWLAAYTCSGVLALGIPGSLLYFLPRSDRPQSSRFMVQAALFMLAMSVLAAAATAVFVLTNTSGAALSVYAIPFVGLWVFASLLDVLFNAQQAVIAQARTNLSFALLRVLLVLGAAILYKSWAAVLSAQLVLVALKAGFCGFSVWRSARPLEKPTRASAIEQVRYSLPFGVSTALYLLRSRIDQWLVASLFSAAQFGLYSIASIFTPIQSLIRMTVNQVVLPEMSRMQSQSNTDEMYALSRRCNVAVGLLMFPVLVFLAVWTEPLLSFLFTDRYNGVAPVLRVYLFGMFIESIEVAWILMAMRQGRFMMTIDGIALPISIVAAFLGAIYIGLPGAAAGGIFGEVVAQIILYRRCSQITGLPMSQVQDWRNLLRVALACCVAGLVSWLVVHAIGIPMLLARLFTAGIVFVAAYWLALKLLGVGPAVRSVLGPRLAGLGGF